MEPADVVYLDHAATTPMRPEAVEAMLPFLGERFANPSGSHRLARDARRAVDESRETVAGVIGCRPGEVVFTGGGSESDNTAITGGAACRPGGHGLVVCAAAEHHAVLHVVEHHGGRVVAVDAEGRVYLDALAAALTDARRDGEDVSVVSVMTVNNEVGCVNDLGAVAAVVGEAAPGARLHTDAVQAPCWVDLRAVWPHVDLLALSAHKFGGPKGVGVLAVRDGVAVEPLIKGGGQERDRRSGTHNVAGIVALAVALAATDVERAGEVTRVGALRDRLVADVTASVDGVRETVPAAAKVAGSAHLLVEGVESEALLFLLDRAGVCASAASACASGAMDPSHVLAAMGVDRTLGAVRLTLGRTTTSGDVAHAAEALVDAIGALRRSSQPVVRR